jgi:Fe-S cluster assembly iron-binding protein IscA
VTKAAQRKLEAFLNRATRDPETALRMIPSSSMEKDVEFVLDERDHSDLVIEDEDGDMLLLIEEDWAADLDGMVLDYLKGSERSGFILTDDESI